VPSQQSTRRRGCDAISRRGCGFGLGAGARACFNRLARKSAKTVAAVLTEFGPHVGEMSTESRAIMRVSSTRLLAAALGAALAFTVPGAGFAQSSPEPKSDKQQTGDGKDPKKVDEYAEAERVLTGPAGNPECVRLGRHVVRLLLNDDLDTAFRNLDLYDRFGCPADHIQATFRCVLKQGEIDSKGTDKLAHRVHACWINPTGEMKGTAAAPSTSTNR
jgi:hypothetical protein